MTENPYAPPSATTEQVRDVPTMRVRSVARVFKIMGWAGVIIYTPIVCISLAMLPVALLGNSRNSDPAFFLATFINSAILAIAICYLMTGRRISAYNIAVRRRALLMCCLMMIGFPIFTVVGAICFRNVKRHFADVAAANSP